MERPAAFPESAAGAGRILARLTAFWEHWGFEPWRDGPFAGVSRCQRFVKGGFMGAVAEYRAWDRIIWEPGTGEEREALWKRLTPLPEVMTQRFVFLVDRPWPERRIRSFTLGFRGYVEFYGYRPMVPGTGRTEARDLTDLVDMALRLETAGGEGDNRGRG